MSTAPPLYEGRQQLTSEWSLVLPFPMARRTEDGSLVFWHTPRGLTFWLNAYDGAPGRDGRGVLESWKDKRSSAAFDEIEEIDGELIRYAYRLDEGGDDGRLPSFYGYMAAPDGGHIFVAAYFDYPELLNAVLTTWRSFAWQD